MSEKPGPSSPPVFLGTEDRRAGLTGPHNLFPHQERDLFFSFSKKVFPVGPREPRPGHVLGAGWGPVLERITWQPGFTVAPCMPACRGSPGEPESPSSTQ